MRPAFLSLVVLAGCEVEGMAPEVDEAALARTAEEDEAILWVANHATRIQIDVDAGLDSRAANAIVIGRSGPDRLDGNADDMPYETIAALDAVPFVGATAFDLLLTYAASIGLLVGATGDVEAAVINLVNTADVPTLDIEAGLDSRAARNIVSHRQGPDATDGTGDDDLFDDLAELDAISYVSQSQLDLLDAYVIAQGLVTAPAPCLILSEMLESSGTYNKAVELTNCGTSSMPLGQYAICLVRNADTTCSVNSRLPAVDIAPGQTWVLCRSKRVHATDPYPWLVQRCDQELASVISFDGDDRILLFRDANGSGRFEPATDGVMDTIGLLAERPSRTPWADVNLRRCNTSPFDGVLGTLYVDRDWFSAFGRNDYSDLGIAPVPGSTCP